MIFNWFVATTVNEVGISWFDFYSIGHICFGIGVFLFFSLLYTIPKSKGYTPILSLFAVFIATAIILVLWEVVENTFLFWSNLKFENRADSIQNSFTDIVLGAIGALGAWLFAYLIYEKEKNIWDYYIFGLISFGLWLGIFVILRYFTLLNAPIFS